MILPSSYAITLALIILGMLCWGSWASLYKAAGPGPNKMRFELFYFDFAIGTVADHRKHTAAGFDLIANRAQIIFAHKRHVDGESK